MIKSKFGTNATVSISSNGAGASSGKFGLNIVLYEEPLRAMFGRAATDPDIELRVRVKGTSSKGLVITPAIRPANSYKLSDGYPNSSSSGSSKTPLARIFRIASTKVDCATVLASVMGIDAKIVGREIHLGPLPAHFLPREEVVIDPVVEPEPEKIEVIEGRATRPRPRSSTRRVC